MELSIQPVVNGDEVIFSQGKITFLWRHPFVSSYFSLLRAQKFFHAFINIALGVFGLGALVLFLYYNVPPLFLVVYHQTYITETILSIITWSDIVGKIFLFSLLSDAWLLSRWSRVKADRPRVVSTDREAEMASGTKEYRVDINKAFDQEAHLALGKALALAEKLNHTELTPLHLFTILFDAPMVQGVISRINIDRDRLTRTTQSALSLVVQTGTALPVPSEDFYSLLMRAYRHAQIAQKHSVDVLDLFTATIDHDTGARRVMEEMDVAPQTIENVVGWFNQLKAFHQKRAEIFQMASLRSSGGLDRAMTGRVTPLLNSMSQDLTRMAQYGQLFPPISRDEEMGQILATVGSSTKNMLLVGPSGAGTTTLINGIAYAMVGEKVPEKLQDKRLVSISAGHVAGTNNPVATFQALLDEVLDSGNIVLVVKNLHDFTAQKGMAHFDLAGVLAETIERTGLVVFATSSPTEYHQFLEDHIVGSLFQKFEIVEPDENKTIQMVEPHIGTLENRFPVYFTYDAITTAVTLATRYIHTTHNPKRAIDLCEQTAISMGQTNHGKRVIVSPEDVEKALAVFSHAKVGNVGRDERDILLHMEDTIHKEMIDQETAVNAVANALRRARMELRETKRPVAVFLFLGPTGVGKTELARTLAGVYFGSRDSMVRLDMSEYQETSSIERLIGGTGSSAQGGTLTEPIRNNPFSLLLLDELEKANSDILNLFLQVFEDGRLTDNKGEVIDFTNTIIIATSNAGSQYIQDALRDNVSSDEIKTHLLEQELKESYTPEFLNRFDDVIVFQPLAEEHIKQIARLMLGRVQEQMATKDIIFEVTDDAIAELAHEGYDPQFGARPMRRVIQRRIEDVLAKILLEQKVGRLDTVVLDVEGKYEIKKHEGLG